MVSYTVTNELHAIEFHDSTLDKAYIQENELYMIFSDAIIQGHSFPDRKDHIPCSVNDGEDRHACPELTVRLRGFHIYSVSRGGHRSYDANGNLIADYPPYDFPPEEYDTFLQRVIAGKNHQINCLAYDAESKTYTLCFFLSSDRDFYEMSFTAETAIAEFEAFGKEAWYLDSKWRNHQN